MDMWEAWLTMVAFTIVLVSGKDAAPGCVGRDYGQGSMVCVCNSTYCDTPEPLRLDQLAVGGVAHYISTKDGKRLQRITARFSSNHISETATTLQVNYDTQFQEILGFGGAATDSATINTFSLSPAAAEKLIRSYFGEDGIGYSFIRVPLGGCDFSTHNYAYTDDHPGDVSLKHFNLSAEDFEHKIPFIKRAKEISPVPIKLLTASWSAPEWMKTIIDPNTKASSLKKEYYNVYADYYIKFLDAYAAKGLRMWGLSPQNQPTGGLQASDWNMMGWQPKDMRQYLTHSLCPKLRAAGYADFKLLIPDDVTAHLSDWLQLYKDEALSECVSGMGVHWYTDKQTSHNILDQVHELQPNKFLLYTEACIEDAVCLGSWERAARYISSIIQVLSHWGAGWLDWNLALDERGGPNWASNYVDAPVIVNITADEFYKQPMFYALAHVSRFVPSGSVRVGLEGSWGSSLEGVAFLTPDLTTVIVLHSSVETAAEIVIADPVQGSFLLEIPANSIHTVVYKHRAEVHTEL